MEDSKKEQKQVVITKAKEQDPSLFSNITAFNNGMQIAQQLCKADLIPASYKNNVSNTMIALETANRMKINPLMVMQNLDIIKGKPSWSSTFIISAINTCGRFKPLRFKFEGKDKTSDDYGCRATAIDLETGEQLNGPLIDWRMVKAEGWLSKTGSKWKTMPELMFQYRAASFFGRLYAADILKGMKSIEENMDISNINQGLELRQIEEINELMNNEKITLSEKEQEYIDNILNDNDTKSYNKVIVHLKSKLDE